MDDDDGGEGGAPPKKDSISFVENIDRLYQFSGIVICLCGFSVTNSDAKEEDPIYPMVDRWEFVSARDPAATDVAYRCRTSDCHPLFLPAFPYFQPSF